MKITLLGGFQMRVGDGAAYWTLKHLLGAKGHSVTLREALGYGMASTPNSCQPVDIANADAVIAYSDGFATYKMLEKVLESHSTIQVHPQVVVGVAGVPDVWFSQVGGFGIWHLDCDLGVMFNVDDQPSSYGVHSETEQILESTIHDFALDSAHKKYNVRCDGLFPAITLPSQKHREVANHQDVLTAIVNCF